MSVSVAIVGSGPTALYALKNLLRARLPLSVTLIEKDAVAGRGMPYSDTANSPAMLANIASIEIPPVTETLVQWLNRQDDKTLQDLGINRGAINERSFYPRLLIGAFFEDQLNRLQMLASANGHQVEVLTRHEVVDVSPGKSDVTLTVRAGEDMLHRTFSHAVLATGHAWPDSEAQKPGYYPSPWPSENIWRIPASRVGVIGTSLSAFDVMSEVARANGLFHYDEAGALRYQQKREDTPLSIALLSRKGVLPEADFYCPLPAQAPEGFSEEAVRALIAGSKAGLLDRVFALFYSILQREDPSYCAGLGLFEPTPERFAAAYFAGREETDPFVHAARNLAEAKANQEATFTVPWRYAILGMHEAFGIITPFLDEDDLKRFNGTLKGVFADNYATVPHQAIERLLALRQAGIVSVEALGPDYDMDRDSVEQGARLVIDDRELIFDHLVDATGQHRLGLADLPFPTLREVLQEGRLGSETEEDAALDTAEDFRLRMPEAYDERIYCLSLPYLIGRYPFIQGLTAASDLGETAARAILTGAEEKTDTADAMIAAA